MNSNSVTPINKIDQTEVLKKYTELLNIKSDINELLPILLDYAKNSNHITEMGVRTPTSTYAFLAGNPDKLISYDINRDPHVSDVEACAPGIFKFILEDVLKVEIEETDFLFIDTFHTAAQLEAELKRHSTKARKFIGFHDTSTFWETGENPYPGMDLSKACGRGLKYAIMPFLKSGIWKIAFLTEINNGLMILERRNKSYYTTFQPFVHLKYLCYLKTIRFRNKLKRFSN